MEIKMNGYNLTSLKEFLPFIDETKYLYLFFIIIFIIVFWILSIIVKSSSKKKKIEVPKNQPSLNDIVDTRDIKISDDNEFVDVLVAIEEEMIAIRELYVGGYISKGVYISETDRLYEKAKIFGI
ncbi:MAG: hypothetical protein CBC25_00340 [Pelagibacteraceae bacterium TMED65]|nr:hypothetical protein [Rickettsiales bacterium]OUU53502.1 MAG: hypothetical protein CBC25_00340 [Pelagibacteraceae bacterium TMED65]|tara:strand:+ start:3951 stop:4325 length:375 start_codon:yes stop_codon:yes gene_type:complete